MQRFFLIVAACSAATATQTDLASAGTPDLGCFERTYTADHLKRFPAQKTTRISVSLSANTAEGSPLPYLVGIIARLRGSADQWVASGGCRLEHGTFMCELDGDSGHVSIRRDLSGLRLEVIDYVMLEGEEAAGELPGTTLRGKSDKVFLLTPANSAKTCAYISP